MPGVQRDIVSTILIPTWSQGQTGRGQGGWTSARFEEAVGRPLSVALRSPIPLDCELDVVDAGGDSWAVGFDDGDRWRVVLEGRPAGRSFGVTDVVDVELATQARARADVDPSRHVAPLCFSCGIQHDSMRVHAGPLHDGTGRFATDWTPPARWADGHGHVDAATVWAALDCASGFYVGGNPTGRSGVTVQYEVELLAPVRADEPHVIVAWSGRWPGEWDGRKRGAGSCVFDAEGRLLARSDSFWVAPAPI